MPWAPLRRCAEPGCTNRQDAVRCRAHERVSARNHRALSPTRRGYDGAYRRAREDLRGLPCALRLAGCRYPDTPIAAGEFTAQHTDAHELVAACAHCNFADGARRARLATGRHAGAGGRR